MSKLSFATFFFFLVGVTGPLFTSSHALAEDRPNFLVIVVDDQSPFDLKCYNPASELQTPTLDRLASEGMVLDAAHHMGSWVGAVCTASRTMIMTGRTLWHVPNKPGRRNNPNADNQKLIPVSYTHLTLPTNREV